MICNFFLACVCNSAGTFGSVNECDPHTGRCLCLRHVIERDCGQCEFGYFNLQPGLGCDRWVGCGYTLVLINLSRTEYRLSLDKAFLSIKMQHVFAHLSTSRLRWPFVVMTFHNLKEFYQTLTIIAIPVSFM